MTRTFTKNKFTYKINFGKCACQNYKQSYNITDPFEYAIIELGGNRESDNLEDKTKYHNQFCIIPKSELINQGILRNDELNDKGEILCKGKESIYICPSDYEKDHWCKQYWIK